MSDHEHAHGDEAAHAKHYIKIWGILLVLLIVSILGPEVGIQIVTLITAFGIAVVKAYLVIKHFMHLDIEKPIIHWMLATAVIFMALFWGGTAADIMRDEGRNWVKTGHEHGVVDAHHGETGAGAQGEAGKGAAGGH